MDIPINTFFVRELRAKNDLKATYFTLIVKGKLDYICLNYLKLFVKNG